MNVLELLAAILNMPGHVFLGVMPNKPDRAVCLAAYSGQVEHFFSPTASDAYSYSVQARCRDPDDVQAYRLAEQVLRSLGRYADATLTCIAATPILDIGYDERSRREYTVNFHVTMR